MKKHKRSDDILRQRGLKRHLKESDKVRIHIFHEGNGPYIRERSWYEKLKAEQALAKKEVKPTRLLEFLSNIPEIFSEKKFKFKSYEVLEVPKIFSFIDNYSESFDFLKQLHLALQKNSISSLSLDYQKCIRIDVDASICMDILLSEFFFMKKQFQNRGLSWGPEIHPINYNTNENVAKFLFSIGAFRGTLKLKFKDVTPLDLLINSRERSDRWNLSELHQTEIVDYIISCLGNLNRSLTIDAETEFYKVIGEVMSNAEEHSSMPLRYAIGYFQEYEDHHYGIFNFTIFNFGETIYEKFKSPACPNKAVVEKMKTLSAEFTNKSFFKPAKFEEETLWTLYALQEGVTSTNNKRGNGSFQYIENFFRLKGNMRHDQTSKLVLISGNSRILFDGTYQIQLKPKQSGEGYHKTITFNSSNDFSSPPDNKYVTFANHYFPGTVISARILINNSNTEVL